MSRGWQRDSRRSSSSGDPSQDAILVVVETSTVEVKAAGPEARGESDCTDSRRGANTGEAWTCGGAFNGPFAAHFRGRDGSGLSDGACPVASRHMLSWGPGTKIFVAREPVDMRRGHDGLCKVAEGIGGHVAEHVRARTQ